MEFAQAETRLSFADLAIGVFHRLWKMIANIPVVVDSGDCCLISRRALDVVTAMPESDFRGRVWLVLNMGVSYHRRDRQKEKLNLICQVYRSHLTVFIPTASFLIG